VSLLLKKWFGWLLEDYCLDVTLRFRDKTWLWSFLMILKKWYTNEIGVLRIGFQWDNWKGVEFDKIASTDPGRYWSLLRYE
jgi:hypothetical protein